MFQGLIVKSVRMIRDRETDTFKGYAYVEFGDKRSYATALGYDGVLFGSKVVKINPAQGRGARGNRRGGPGFDRGGGGRGGFNPRGGGGDRPPYRGGFNNGRGGGGRGYFPQGDGGRGRYGSTFQGSGGPNPPFDEAGGPSDMPPDAREDEFDGGRGGGGFSRGGGFRGRPMGPYGGGPAGSYGFRGGPPPGFRGGGGYGPPPGYGPRGAPGGGSSFGRPPQQFRNRTLSSRSDKGHPDPELREPSPDSAAARPKLHLDKRSTESALHEQVHTSRNASIFGTGRPRPPSPSKEEGATKTSTEKLASPPISPNAVDAHLTGDVENMHLGPVQHRERHESGGAAESSGSKARAVAAERGHRSESGVGGGEAEGEHEAGPDGDYEDGGPAPAEEVGGFTFQHQDP
jgi:hypothetical protein